MAYELYKTILKKETYFDSWKDNDWKSLAQSMLDRLYNKYVVKCKTFQRDNFTCQNRNGEAKKCIFCRNIKEARRLTIHHVKFRKNKGEDKVRNSVTLCKKSHDKYHQGEFLLVFSDVINLPPHISGHKFMIHKPEKEINWKEVKAEMRKLRQEIKFKLGESIKKIPVEKRMWFKITEEQILALMKFLVMYYEDMYDDD